MESTADFNESIMYTEDNFFDRSKLRTSGFDDGGTMKLQTEQIREQVAQINAQASLIQSQFDAMRAQSEQMRGLVEMSQTQSKTQSQEILSLMEIFKSFLRDKKNPSPRVDTFSLKHRESLSPQHSQLIGSEESDNSFDDENDHLKFPAQAIKLHVRPMKTDDGRNFLAWAKDTYTSESIALQQHRPIVHCKLKFYRISNLNLSSMQVEVDFVLMLDWIDQSIIQYRDDIDVEPEHFSPFVHIHNAVNDNIHPVAADKAVNRRQNNPEIEGHVKRTEQYKTKVYIPDLSLEKFPFDEHCINIVLKGDHIEIRTDGTLLPGEEKSPRLDFTHENASKDYFLPGWIGKGFDKDKIIRRDKTGTTISVAVKVRRNPYRIVMLLVVPLIACNIIGMSSFMLAQTELGYRLMVTLASLVLVASIQQQAHDHVPKNLPYTTVFDNYILSHVALICLQAFLHVLTCTNFDSERELMGFFNCVTDSQCVTASSSSISRSSGSSTSSSSSSPCSDDEPRSSILVLYFFILVAVRIVHRAKELFMLARKTPPTSTPATNEVLIGGGGATGCDPGGAAPSKFSGRPFQMEEAATVVVATGWVVYVVVGWVCWVLFVVVFGAALKTLCLQGPAALTELGELCGDLAGAFMVWVGEHCWYSTIPSSQYASNPYLCRPAVILTLKTVFSDESALGFMVFAILFVHYNLWKEYVRSQGGTLRLLTRWFG